MGNCMYLYPAVVSNQVTYCKIRAKSKNQKQSQKNPTFGSFYTGKECHSALIPLRLATSHAPKSAILFIS